MSIVKTDAEGKLQHDWHNCYFNSQYVMMKSVNVTKFDKDLSMVQILSQTSPVIPPTDCLLFSISLHIQPHPTADAAVCSWQIL